MRPTITCNCCGIAFQPHFVKLHAGPGKSGRRKYCSDLCSKESQREQKAAFCRIYKSVKRARKAKAEPIPGPTIEQHYRTRAYRTRQARKKRLKFILNPEFRQQERERGRRYNLKRYAISTAVKELGLIVAGECEQSTIIKAIARLELITTGELK